jgi:hypothetical protein
MSLNLGMVNLIGLDPGRISTKLKHLLFLGFVAISRVVWSVERVVGRFPANAYVSPYIAAVARKPA